MSRAPTRKEVIEEFGITDTEFDRYVVRCHEYAKPGGWLVTFSEDVPLELRRKFKFSETLTRPILIG